jgi:small GTP-binding protein
MLKKDLLNIISIAKSKSKSNKSVDLSINGIKSENLDSEIINELQYFEEINLSGNILQQLPTNFKELTKLKKLNISTNYLKIFPQEIVYLVNLEFLDMRDNLFFSIPKDTNKLNKLKFLYLKGNPLKKIPEVIFELKNLKVLGLVNIQINTIPSNIKKLINLESLWIGKNKIKNLPEGLLTLPLLKNITLDDNPLPIPKDILNTTQSKNELFNLYIQYNQELLDRKYETKIIIVGESQAGKTSLLNRLIYNKFYDDELKTEDINIDKWNLHLSNKIVTANIWDFGGQDILYSLHKFFLTDNSIYIVVWDSRNENQSKKIELWLKKIISINKKTKVLLVMNKADEHNTSVDKIKMKKIAKDIVFFNISCKKNWNIDKIEIEVKNILENNSEFIQTYNKKYLSLKKHLKNTKRNYIALEEFYELCKKEGIEDKNNNSILETFKQIGIVLHYPTNDRLHDIVIINIDWLIKGIYSIINWISENENDGSFTFNDLSKIYENVSFEYKKDIYHFIIDSLIHFNIIFKKDRKYYIPNMLSYFDKDIEQLRSENFLVFELNIEHFEVDFFYKLLAIHSRHPHTKFFFRNVLNITLYDTNIYIYLDNFNHIYIYINKTIKNSVSKAIEYILEEFKSIVKNNHIDINIILPDNTKVSIRYLKYLLSKGQTIYISLLLNEYNINKILGNAYVDKIPNILNITNIEYIESVQDIITDFGTKNIQGNHDEY